MIELLDHGYLKVIENWGSDERIIEAARMSTHKGFMGWERDQRLLEYLYKNNHATPFEMAGMVIEVQAPLFVFREWHRHRTQSYNELSARYTPMPNLNYVPTVDRMLVSNGRNKQASTVVGSDKLTPEIAELLRRAMVRSYSAAEDSYRTMLAAGMPKELARCVIPVARYSRMRASANLRNWLAFLTLRQAPNAQWEIRQYADAMNTALCESFPRTMALFNA